MDLLDQERQKVFSALKKFADRFVLAGGTAMMLQLKHRLSFDFDCFSEEELSPYLLKKIKRAFGNSIFISVKTEEMIIIKTPGKVDISFVYYPYKPIHQLIKTESLSLSHLDDLVANKAYTVGRRNTWRDYVDLFYVMKKNLYPIKKIIDLAEKKFSGEFNPKLFLGQLTYFDDLEIVPISFLKNSFTANQIKSFLGIEVKKYLKNLKLG